MLTFSKYKRAFLFGCSFTRYMWPTWADLIAKEIPETYVYAKSGAGNFYMYQAIMEAVMTHNITKDDLVMVMFSNVTREDRYTRSEGWITPGNLFHQDTYNDEFIRKFFCEKGYLMRDLSLIKGIDAVLSQTGADYELMSMIGLDSLSSDDIKMTGVDEVLNLYSDVISKIKPSVFDVIFNGNWNNVPLRPKYIASWAKGVYTDNHPTPDEHLEYIRRTFPGTIFKESTIEFAHETTNKLLDCKTQAEIEEYFEHVRVRPATRL